jgi:hypothetical protein
MQFDGFMNILSGAHKDIHQNKHEHNLRELFLAMVLCHESISI